MSVLADWLVRQAPAWLDGSRPITPAQRRALQAIVRCRTPALGGHVYRCTDCAQIDFAYHSCHHRACPRCGGARTAAWTKKQTERLLPVPYFLVTFTVPEAVRMVCRTRPKLFFDLFFAQAAQALQTVAAIPRHLGAELGFVGVLHTWGRQLQLHPHLHFIVPGGGISSDGRQWKNSHRSDWLLRGDVVAAQLRRGLEEALRAAAPELHAQLPDSCWREGWWVHTRPAGSGAAVVRYLARYVHRTAISDERILHADDHFVRFAFTDTATGERRECTLSAEKFMRRYLQHVLPPGQHRVRYFGWMHPARKRRRCLAETLLAVVIVVRATREEPPPWHRRCPHCHAFALVRIGHLARGPPLVCHR
jgi:Putative transposase/Transposase zinc-binding domain